MEPTLFTELVDRTDPDHPVVLRRAVVTVLIDDDETFRTDDGWNVIGGDVRGGHMLFLGDVIVGVDMDDPERAWLCEVIQAEGIPMERYYTLRRLRPWVGNRVWMNDDPRWDAWITG